MKAEKEIVVFYQIAGKVYSRAFDTFDEAEAWSDEPENAQWGAMPVKLTIAEVDGQRVAVLTQHAINVLQPDGTVIELPPSGAVARVDVRSEDRATVLGVPAQETQFTSDVYITFEERGGVLHASLVPDVSIGDIPADVLVVSTMTLQALKRQGWNGRQTVVSPGRVARDEGGKPIGVQTWNILTSGEPDAEAKLKRLREAAEKVHDLNEIWPLVMDVLGFSDCQRKLAKIADLVSSPWWAEAGFLAGKVGEVLDGSGACSEKLQRIEEILRGPGWDSTSWQDGAQLAYLIGKVLDQ